VLVVGLCFSELEVGRPARQCVVIAVDFLNVSIVITHNLRNGGGKGDDRDRDSKHAHSISKGENQ